MTTNDHKVKCRVIFILQKFTNTDGTQRRRDGLHPLDNRTRMGGLIMANGVQRVVRSVANGRHGH